MLFFRYIFSLLRFQIRREVKKLFLRKLSKPKKVNECISKCKFKALYAELNLRKSMSAFENANLKHYMLTR